MERNSSQKTMNMTSNTNSDRISSLPDSIIHHIFSISSITTKQALQMSLLSKQWRHFWKSLPYIRFESLEPFYKKEEKFITVLRKLVALRDESNLHAFYLTEKRDWYTWEDKDDELIDFLITLDVQELHLLLPLYISNSAVIRLFNRNHIRSLELEEVIIRDVECDGELIISSSSVENLVLDCKYEDGGSITIHAPKLKYLKFWNNYYDRIGDIKIDAPALTQIHLCGVPFYDFSLENTSSLIDVIYDINIRCNEYEPFTTFSNILKALVTAKSFTFSTSHLEIWSSEGPVENLENHLVEGPAEDLEYFWNPIPNSVLNINYLKVLNWHTSFHIRTLTKFIEKFTSLETLVLKIETYQYSDNVPALVKNGKDWDEQLGFECRFYKLKSVEIRNIQGHKNELIFIAFLLRSAPVLEKLNISITRSLLSGDKLEYSEKLYSLPSFSPSVMISIRFT